MKTTDSQKYYDYLDRVEAYDATALNCYAFRRGTDVIDGRSMAIGNMVSGFPFEIEGVPFLNSEAAYIAGMFSDGSEKHQTLQQALVENTNGYMAKKSIRRPNENNIRPDYWEFNLQWMLYVVWCKAIGNADFRRLLTAIPADAVIIEDSTFQIGYAAAIWGTKNQALRALVNTERKRMKKEGMCKAEMQRAMDSLRLGAWRKQGVYEGKNIMGKILMSCRDAILQGTLPPIDIELLRGKRIYLLGKVLTFDHIPMLPAK